MRRRQFVTFLGSAAVWPFAAAAQQSSTPGMELTDKTGIVLDPRLTPARRDLAASHLAGKLAAERFVEGTPYQIGAAQAPIRDAPAHDAALLTEALKGEGVTIYDLGEEGWAWGQLAADGYVGYLPASALAPVGPDATHKVTALRTFVFPGSSIKLPPVETLSFGCRLAVDRIEEPFAVLVDGGCIPALHLAPVATSESDFVAVAERFLGTPYLWGGKTSLGIDCSGLLQLALDACAVSCPRDTDMQERALGRPLVNPLDLSQLQRGDLLFWNGHVAIGRDTTTVLHANAYHMAVAIEDAAQAVDRIAAAGTVLTSIRRLSGA